MFSRIRHPELVKVAIFGLLSLMFAFLFISGLVKNGNGAVERYETLIAVDKAGGDVEDALNELRGYIYSHMNTEIGGPNSIYPPIQLSGTYERLVAAEQARVEQANANLYSEAQAYCEKTSSQGFSGSNRLACINKYIDDNGAKVQDIDDSLYKYDFVAPRWSPDLAGYSLIGLLVFTVLTLFYLFLYLRTKHMVHYSN
jgi:hypothetical protein